MDRREPIQQPAGFAAWAARVLHLPHRDPAAEFGVLRAAADEHAWSLVAQAVDCDWIVHRPWRDAYVELVRSWEDGHLDMRRERERIIAFHQLAPLDAGKHALVAKWAGELRRLHGLSAARECAARVCQAAMDAGVAEEFFEALKKEGAAFRKLLKSWEPS